VNPDQIFQLIVRNVVEVMPDLEDHEFSGTDQLKELGLNSLDRTDVIAMSLEALNLQIPLVEIRGANNIGELAQLLHAKLQG
jgi:polyketide biosynthesis acyl carrier protein